jgi:hypothetical protein
LVDTVNELNVFLKYYKGPKNLRNAEGKTPADIYKEKSKYNPEYSKMLEIISK